MFFPDKIKNIQPNFKVLEIGPGAHPFYRSDILLELEYESEEEKIAQFGHDEKLITDKKIVYYKGEKFPFSDNEFDYVICSHVLEHVDNIPNFLNEIFRVSKMGYFEFPLIYYEFLYNINAHQNFLKFDTEKSLLYYMPKNSSNIDFFKPIQNFLLETLRLGHSKMITDMPEKFIQGFEWNSKFSAIETNDLNLFIHKNTEIPQPSNCPLTLSEANLSQLIKQLIKRVIHK